MEVVISTIIASKQTIAAFDFDGTLTYCDSLLPFLCFSAGSLTTIGRLAIQSPQLISYVFGKASRQETKEGVLKRFLPLMSFEEATAKGEQFASNCLNRLVRAEGIKCLQWHLDRGHRCILVSANIDLFLIPWAKQMGFHDIITSRCEIGDNGLFTGRLVGLNCWGPEKVRRLQELIGSREQYLLYAYGDSRGDRELLAFADYSFYRKFNAS